MRIPGLTTWRYRLTVTAAIIAACGGAVTLLAATIFQAGRRAMETQLRPYVLRDGGDLDALKARYGPSANSLDAEEWIVRDFFQDRRGGVFVDVGANHYQRESNTYYLDTRLEWSGLAIEPQTQYAADYARFRPRTRFVPLFISDKSDVPTTLFVPDRASDASGDEVVASDQHRRRVMRVPTQTATLDQVLETYHVPHVDFLSIDVEEHEPQVLRGFSINRVQPALVCIEAWPGVRQQILDYFAAHQYVIVSKYLRLDTGNLWFQPLSQ
jgi:FkbM family methyltransferase